MTFVVNHSSIIKHVILLCYSILSIRGYTKGIMTDPNDRVYLMIELRGWVGGLNPPRSFLNPMLITKNYLRSQAKPHRKVFSGCCFATKRMLLCGAFQCECEPQDNCMEETIVLQVGLLAYLHQ